MYVYYYFFDGKELVRSSTNFGYDRKFSWFRTVAENRHNQFCVSKNSILIFGKKLRLKPNASLNPVLNSWCALITMFFYLQQKPKKKHFIKHCIFGWKCWISEWYVWINYPSHGRISVLKWNCSAWYLKWYQVKNHLVLAIIVNATVKMWWNRC